MIAFYRTDECGLPRSASPQLRSEAEGPACSVRANYIWMGSLGQLEKFLLCSISLIMTEFNRLWEMSNLGTLVRQGLWAVGCGSPARSSVRCQREQRPQQTSKFCFRIPPKASQVANVDICARLWLSCSCFFSLICRDNHFPVLLNKHRLPCLNTLTVPTEHTAFNLSVLSTLAREPEKRIKTSSR